MAAGESPKVAISSPAQYCGLRLRRGAGSESCRRSSTNQEYRGQRLAGLAHEIFLKLLKAKREVPGAAERQKTLAAQDGKCALCGCGLTAGTCELDHVVPVRLCDIRSWGYTTFPGHFDMVWASPVCTEYSRALTTRPRRLLEGDALAPSALEIIAHFDPLMWVIENPATGLLKTRPFVGAPALGGRGPHQVRNSYRKQTRLWTNMRWRPRRSL